MTENSRKIELLFVFLSSLSFSVLPLFSSKWCSTDKTQNLVRQNTRQIQSQEAYNAKYNALAERYEKASAKHDKLEAEVARRKNKARQLASFIDHLEKAPASLEEWDSQVWSLLLEKGTVNRDGSVAFEFRNGKEIKVEAK